MPLSFSTIIGTLPGRFEEALRIGKQALDFKATPLTTMAVIRSLHGLERTKEALDLAEKALRMFPDDLDIKMAKAVFLNLAGRDKECIKLVRSMGATAAIMITPLLDMAECLVRARRYDQALKSYRSARKNLESLQLKEKLEDFYIRAVRGEVNTVLQEGKKHEALRILDALGDDYLVNTSLWVLKAGLCIDLKRYKRALILIEYRAKVAPVDPNVAFYRAQVLWQLNKPGQALAAVDEAVRVAAKETPAALNLKARILASISRYNEAMNLLLREMELQAAAKEVVSLGSTMLAAQWLPKCEHVPLVGLQMATAWLGVLCTQEKRPADAKKVVKQLASLDWTPVQQAAEAGDCASRLALAILQKAQNHLRERPAGPTPAEHATTKEDQPSQEPTVLESLLRHFLKTPWPKRGI